jgi:hypothetical protein
MTQATPCSLMFHTFILASLCLAPMIGRSQDNPVGPSTQGPDPAYGNCPAPAQSGVNVCQPTDFGGASPLQVIAAATGGRGEVKGVQLWADGSKVAEVNGNVFNQTVKLALGNHQLTLVELDSTGFYVKSAPVPVLIRFDGGNPCDPPNAPGVHVCQPDGCHGYPWTTLAAAGTGVNPPVVRMELWVDGAKMANFPGNKIDTDMNLPDFSYGTIIEVDSKGGFIKSPPYLIVSC